MKLRQKDFGRGEQSFEIFGDHVCVRIRNRFGISEFQVPLYILGKHPQISRFNPVGALSAAVFFAMMSIICLLSEFVFKVGDPAVLTVFAAVGLFVTPLIMYHWKTCRFNYLIFHNIFSGQVALVFWINNPDKAQFETFINCLTEKITSHASAAQKAGAQLGISGEIRKLYDLWKEGVISEEEYTAGKVKVLATDGDEWKY